MSIVKKRIFSKNKELSSKVFFTGKSYKISVKNSVYNLRFNRVNKTVLVMKNSTFFNKSGQKKLYMLNESLSPLGLKSMCAKARLANTYTLRGLYSSKTVLAKRSGRISEYM